MADQDVEKRSGMVRWRPRLIWIFPALATLALLVQCGPVPGCYAGTKLYSTGDHFGFRVGMSQEDAVALAQAVVGERQVEVDALKGKVNDTSDLAYMKGGDLFQQLRFPRRQRVCWSTRNTVLRFQAGKVAAIIDELDITYP